MSKELVRTEELSMVKNHHDEKTVTYNPDLHREYQTLAIVWYGIMGIELTQETSLVITPSKGKVLHPSSLKRVIVVASQINSECAIYMKKRKNHPVYAGDNKARMYRIKDLKKFIIKHLKSVKANTL